MKSIVNNSKSSSKKRTFIKPLLYAVFALFICLSFGFITITDPPLQINDNAFISKLKKEFTEFYNKAPEDRVYLQFDKPFYKPGETIWFSAYVRNGSDLKASDQSEILYIELISPKGNVEKKINLIARNGKTNGDFDLGEELPGGIYKIKAYTKWQQNEKRFFEKEFQVQKVVLPNLKMKLDFERKAFGAGDEVIAKLKLETNQNESLADFPFRFISQLAGNKHYEGKSETDDDGICYIKFDLPDRLESNDGLLNVLISFEGQTESISRSIPIVLNQIDFTMYPEGGDLVEGFKNRIAFKAMNEFGKPADVEGLIINSKGKEVATFSSFHQGMGAFEFEYENNEKYYATITKPEGIEKRYLLQEAYEMGYILNINRQQEDNIEAIVRSSVSEQITLTGQLRGRMYYSNAIDIEAGETTIVIPTKDLPMGVAQFTLFDGKGIERAERLTYINKDKYLNISIEADKEEYLPREKVQMTIKVKDERGMPMPADLSLTVVNDQLLSFADDKSGNIISQLLLEQDLGNKIEEPTFYFDKKEEKSDEALDYLLMTSGWRRYTWKQIRANDVPAFAHQAEKAIIKGTIIDIATGKPVPNAKIMINSESTVTETDEGGEFIIRNIDMTESKTLNASVKGYNDLTQNIATYATDMKLYMYDVDNYGTWSITTKAEGRGKGRMGNIRMNAPAGAVAGAGLAVDNNNVDIVFENERFGEVIEEKKEEVQKDIKNAEVNNLKIEPEDAAMDIAKNAAQEVLKNADKARADKRDQADFDGIFDMEEILAGDDELAAFIRADPGPDQAQQQQVLYYRAKEFSAPQYNVQDQVTERTDFRPTIFWDGAIEIDRTGKKNIEFYNSDEISSFRTIVEGISVDGMVGRAEKTFFTQLPFAMKAKVPSEVATKDIVSVPLTLKNNTGQAITGLLEVIAPDGLESIGKIESEHSIAANSTKIVYMDYKVSNKTGSGNFNIVFTSEGLRDAFNQTIDIVAKGFPVTASFSGKHKEKNFSVDLQNVVDGSIQVEFTAYPSVVSDLMKGVEAILREPYGCFEQTSMTSYPNLLVLDYLKTTENNDQQTISRAEKLLDKGYKRLVSFETSEKGYEWFGGSPGHEALSAYGLMQFNDMIGIYDGLDRTMVDRTADWLLERRDGKGGFKRNSRALDSYGSASEEITNAYIVYALTEAGYDNLDKEIEFSCKNAAKSNDPYMMGLAANTLFNEKENDQAEEVLSILYSKQDKNGSWTGTDHSITHSTGKSLSIETTSLVLMALLKSDNPTQESIRKAVEFLVSSRDGYGSFGNSQGTIMALKALTEYAKFSKKTDESGTIEFYVDGKKVATKTYEAGETEPVEITGLSEYISSGKNELSVKYIDANNPLPYSLAVRWNTFLPNSQQECLVGLETKLSTKEAKVGETVRFTAKIKNRTDGGLPSTTAIIGIPAGLSAQPWQLKELQEKEVFDYYEIKGNKVVLYYRQMIPNEKREINLDLKAEIPGEFAAPASSAYLYYTNEFKTWDAVETIKIKS